MRRNQPWGPGGGGFCARRNAFTLIEMLVCVMIIMMLISLMLTGLRRSRDAARDVVCQSRLHELSLVMVVYADAYKCVPVWGTMGAVPMLGLEQNQWACPSDKAPPAYEMDS